MCACDHATCVNVHIRVNDITGSTAKTAAPSKNNIYGCDVDELCLLFIITMPQTEGKKDHRTVPVVFHILEVYDHNICAKLILCSCLYYHALQNITDVEVRLVDGHEFFFKAGP